MNECVGYGDKLEDGENYLASPPVVQGWFE